VSSPRNPIPIWARPEPGSRRPRFTREQIAAAALAIADAEGFEAVSMRRVAAELGAGTMTLYHYVSNKDDLVALMDDALIGESLIPDAELPTDWRAALTAIARKTRSTFLRHPWALMALRGLVPGPNGMLHFEQSLAALAQTPLGVPSKIELLGIVDDYVFGHVMRAGETHLRQAPEPEAAKALEEFGATLLKSGRYPHIAALYSAEASLEDWEKVSGLLSDEERFERGLQTLLDGAAIRLGLAS
jgi:AcrR family transcriptional regulator